MIKRNAEKFTAQHQTSYTHTSHKQLIEKKSKNGSTQLEEIKNDAIIISYFEKRNLFNKNNIFNADLSFPYKKFFLWHINN
jgi:hypothetical protein